MQERTLTIKPKVCHDGRMSFCIYIGNPSYKEGLAVEAGGKGTWQFASYKEAFADCERRMSEYASRGIKASFVDSLEQKLNIAYVCPYCNRKNAAPIHHSLTLIDGVLSLSNSFECFFCFEHWGQAIKAEIGGILQNKIIKK